VGVCGGGGPQQKKSLGAVALGAARDANRKAAGRECWEGDNPGKEERERRGYLGRGTQISLAGWKGGLEEGSYRGCSERKSEASAPDDLPFPLTTKGACI